MTKVTLQNHKKIIRLPIDPCLIAYIKNHMYKRTNFREMLYINAKDKTPMIIWEKIFTSMYHYQNNEESDFS